MPVCCMPYPASGYCLCHVHPAQQIRPSPVVLAPSACVADPTSHGGGEHPPNLRSLGPTEAGPAGEWTAQQQHFQAGGQLCRSYLQNMFPHRPVTMCETSFSTPERVRTSRSTNRPILLRLYGKFPRVETSIASGTQSGRLRAQFWCATDPDVAWEESRAKARQQVTARQTSSRRGNLPPPSLPSHASPPTFPFRRRWMSRPSRSSRKTWSGSTLCTPNRMSARTSDRSVHCTLSATKLLTHLHTLSPPPQPPRHPPPRHLLCHPPTPLLASWVVSPRGPLPAGLQRRNREVFPGRSPGQGSALRALGPLLPLQACPGRGMLDTADPGNTVCAVWQSRSVGPPPLPLQSWGSMSL